jgi:hypothetical protein
MKNVKSDIDTLDAHPHENYIDQQNDSRLNILNNLNDEEIRILYNLYTDKQINNNLSVDLEYIYLIREREFIRLNEDTYKIGRTSQIPSNRLIAYPKGSEILFVRTVLDSKLIESVIKKQFANEFIKRKEYGNEYFSGDMNNMIRKINIIIDDITINANKNVGQPMIIDNINIYLSTISDVDVLKKSCESINLNNFNNTSFIINMGYIIYNIYKNKNEDCNNGYMFFDSICRQSNKYDNGYIKNIWNSYDVFNIDNTFKNKLYINNESIIIDELIKNAQQNNISTYEELYILNTTKNIESYDLTKYFYETYKHILVYTESDGNNIWYANKDNKWIKLDDNEKSIMYYIEKIYYTFCDFCNILNKISKDKLYEIHYNYINKRMGVLNKCRIDLSKLKYRKEIYNLSKNLFYDITFENQLKLRENKYLIYKKFMNDIKMGKLELSLDNKKRVFLDDMYRVFLNWVNVNNSGDSNNITRIFFKKRIEDLLNQTSKRIIINNITKIGFKLELDNHTFV